MWMTQRLRMGQQRHLYTSLASFALSPWYPSLLIAVLHCCVCCSSAHQLRLRAVHIPAHLICPLVTDTDQMIELFPNSPRVVQSCTVSPIAFKSHFPKKKKSVILNASFPFLCVEVKMPSPYCQGTIKSNGME